MTDTATGDDVECQHQLALDGQPDHRVCSQCGQLFAPRRHSGGSVQRFCTTDCRLTFHRERQRAQRTALYAGPTALSATKRPAPNEEASEREDSFVLMGQQDFIEVAWDRHGNLLLRQDPLYEGEQELRVSRDYFPRFLQALDVLRELIAEAIREGEAS